MIGIISIGSSIPRSPRATMMPPVAASTISSAASVASRFSIFAITGMSMPRSASRMFTGSRSAALRTNETAIRSTPRSQQKSIQSKSAWPSADGTASAPGRFMPWCEVTVPPVSTFVKTSVPSVSRTRRRIDPSAR